MKALILTAMMMVGLSLQAAPTSDFDFSVSSPRDGLVTFGDFTAVNGWPNIRGQVVSTVRWYYSTEGFDSITPDGPFVEQWLNPRDYTIPVLGIGNLDRGMRYYFKAGLADRNGDLIYFTNDYETDTARHSVVVR